MSREKLSGFASKLNVVAKIRKNKEKQALEEKVGKYYRKLTASEVNKLLDQCPPYRAVEAVSCSLDLINVVMFSGPSLKPAELFEALDLKKTDRLAIWVEFGGTVEVCILGL